MERPLECTDGASHRRDDVRLRGGDGPCGERRGVEPVVDDRVAIGLESTDLAVSRLLAREHVQIVAGVGEVGPCLDGVEALDRSPVGGDDAGQLCNREYGVPFRFALGETGRSVVPRRLRPCQRCARDSHSERVHRRRSRRGRRFDDRQRRGMQRSDRGDLARERFEFRLGRQAVLEQQEHRLLERGVPRQFLQGKAADRQLARLSIDLAEPRLVGDDAVQALSNWFVHTATIRLIDALLLAFGRSDRVLGPAP